MEEVVRLHQKGRSLREIAGYLDVHHETVRRDLQRWEEDQKVSHLRGRNATKTVGFETPECDSNVVHFPSRSNLP
jgi:IS30 family transposase